MKPELMHGTPPGSIDACHPSGLTQSEIFTQWCLPCIKYTKPINKDPVIWVADGHYSHTRNLEVINLARENRIDIICLPPHNRHKRQPLDKVCMEPLKTFYSQEIEIELSSNLGWASRHHLRNWRTIRQCIKASCKRRDGG